MSVKMVTVVEYRCDGCQRAVWAPEEDVPEGYTGAVTFQDGSLGGEFRWFACRKAHIGSAVKGALATFVAEGTATDEPAPEAAPQEGSQEGSREGAQEGTQEGESAPEGTSESAPEGTQEGAPEGETPEASGRRSRRRAG